jgi:hypothetical protein
VGWIRSRQFLLVSASALLVVVGLLAFGEQAQARRGHYHLDGGRGWGLPSAVSLDASHAQPRQPLQSKLVVTFDRSEDITETFIYLSEASLPQNLTPLIWFRLRPPPLAS